MDIKADVSLHYLDRPEGRIGYSLQGDGPLVVAVPGMGDLSTVYRDLVDTIVGSGHRLALVDLRGHGTSDTGFTRHGDVETGSDILALIDHLGGPAVIVGNSMGASAAAWAAAERPDAVAGLVMFGPFLREPPRSAFARTAMRLAFRLAFSPPWGAAAWATIYRSLNTGTRAPWLDEHAADIRQMLRQPGRLRSFRHLAVQLDHSPVEARVAQIQAPSLVFIGSLDPDFADPAAELDWITAHIPATGHLVPGVGHYVQSQAPGEVTPALGEFLTTLRRARG